MSKQNIYIGNGIARCWLVALVALLFVVPSAAQTMASMNTPSNQEYIDNLFKTIEHNASIPLVKSRNYKPLDYFAKANLAADATSWASGPAMGGQFAYSGVLNSIVVNDQVYRLPTEEEMAYLAPTIEGPDAPTFYKSGKVQVMVERVCLPGREPFVCVSDYVGRGKGVIYGLRFRRPLGEEYEKSANDDIYDPVVRKNFDYADCRAYRYEWTGSSLVISIKQVAANDDVKKVKDVDNDRWWSKQTGAETFTLPVVSGGETIYLCSQNRCFSISTQSLTLTDYRGGMGYARLYQNPQATYERATRFMHASLYGENLYVDEPVDATEATAVSYKQATLKVYVRTNPGASSIKYDDGSTFPYGTIDTRKLSGNTVLHTVSLNKNYSAEARRMNFTLTADADATQQLHFTFTQPPLEIEAINDSIPIDYCAESNLNHEGNWMLDDEMPGMFNFNEAIREADVSDYDDFHLPTMEEMACILPPSEVSLNRSVHEMRYETIEFNNRKDIFVNSQYYGTGNGTLYALRFTGTEYRCAFRYRFQSGTGLVVDILPLGLNHRDLVNATDIAYDELFERSDTYLYVFPASGGDMRSNMGECGTVWTSTLQSSGNATAFYYDDEVIKPMTVEPLNTYLAVRPFIGHRNLKLAAERQPEPEPAYDNVIEPADDAQPVIIPERSIVRPSTTRRIVRPRSSTITSSSKNRKVQKKTTTAKPQPKPTTTKPQQKPTPKKEEKSGLLIIDKTK
ncbi:MAG: hypothetical protein K5893_12040 [Prevotella sp.]|nr:hypothetical protein [Prevotella sp.]